MDGMNYRDTAGDVTPAAVDARALYLTARQTLTTSDFNKVSLMVPAGSGVTSAAEEINGVWQKEFSLFFSVEEVDEETFAKRLAEGDYTIALAPISAEGGSVYNMLNQFTAAGGGLTGYALNPARDLGPRIAHAILPIKGKGSSNFKYGLIVPIFGPIIGGIVAVLLYNVIPW